MVASDSSTNNKNTEVTPSSPEWMTHLQEMLDDPLTKMQVTRPSTNDLGWLNPLFTQVNLPLRQPRDGSSEWIKENGGVRLSVQAGDVFDVKTGEYKKILPYGKIARAGLLYFLSEIYRTGERKIQLGNTQGEFMERLGFQWGGSSGKRLQQQLGALASARFSITTTVFPSYTDSDGETKTGAAQVNRQFLLANESALWFGSDPHQLSLFPAFIVASEEMMRLAEKPMPVDMRHWRWLNEQSKSAFPLDVYLWLAERAHRASGTGTFIKWDQLQNQFGATFKSLAGFQRAFWSAVSLVQKVYPEAKIVKAQGGVILYKSPPAVRNNRPSQFLTS